MTVTQASPGPRWGLPAQDAEGAAHCVVCPRCDQIVERVDSGEEPGFDPVLTDPWVFVPHSRLDVRDGRQFLLRCPGSGKNPHDAAEGF